jgi:hypothetical protein
MLCYTVVSYAVSPSFSIDTYYSMDRLYYPVKTLPSLFSRLQFVFTRVITLEGTARNICSLFLTLDTLYVAERSLFKRRGRVTLTGQMSCSALMYFDFSRFVCVPFTVSV